MCYVFQEKMYRRSNGLEASKLWICLKMTKDHSTVNSAHPSSTCAHNYVLDVHQYVCVLTYLTIPKQEHQWCNLIGL